MTRLLRVLLLLWLTTSVAAAQDFPVNPNVTLRLSPDENNLTVNPNRTPVLASVWLSAADLKKLTKTVYKVMSAQHDLPRHQ